MKPSLSLNQIVFHQGGRIENVLACSWLINFSERDALQYIVHQDPRERAEQPNNADYSTEAGREMGRHSYYWTAWTGLKMLMMVLM